MGSKGHQVGWRVSPRGAPTASPATWPQRGALTANLSPKSCTHCQCVPKGVHPLPALQHILHGMHALASMSPKGVQRDAHTETLPAHPLMDAPTSCLAVCPQIQVPRQMSPPQSLTVCPHSWVPKGTCPLLKCPQRVAPITTPGGVPQTMQPLTHILSAGCPCAQAPECPCYHLPLPPPALHTHASSPPPPPPHSELIRTQLEGLSIMQGSRRRGGMQMRLTVNYVLKNSLFL